MEVYEDSKNLLGDTSCIHGTEAVVGALERGSRAREPGGLQAFSQNGLDAPSVYRRYDRSSGKCNHGALHAKVFYRKPFVIVGSSNWAIASEANREMGVLLQATNEEALSYVERPVTKLSLGARQVSAEHIRSKPMKQDRFGGRVAKNRR